MSDLRFDLLLVGVWAIGFVILVVGVAMTWLYRLPGTYLGDFMNGPKGQHAPRAWHQFRDAMRLVRPAKHKLIYFILLTGSTICVGTVVAGFLIAFLVPGAIR